jgi:hypothetical protein
MKNDIEVPLNILKEKVLYSLPTGTEVEDNAIIVISQALKHFLNNFSQNLPISLEADDKKLKIKHIKSLIQNEDKKYFFLKGLVDNK